MIYSKKKECRGSMKEIASLLIKKCNYVKGKKKKKLEKLFQDAL